MTRKTRLLLFCMILPMLSIFIPCAQACDPPGPCYNWDSATGKWVAYGCRASGCPEDCTYCDLDSCACEPTCVDPVADFDVVGFTDTQEVIVLAGPVIKTEVVFDGSDSCDDDDTTLLYSWDFGDGHTDGPWVNVSHVYEEGGEYTAQLVVLDSDNAECSDDCPNHTSAPAERSIRALNVGLEPLPAGNSPDLENGRMCFNAQEEYKKAKWKAIVKGGGTAAVSSTGAVNVSFSGIDGADPAALQDEDEFWVNSPSATGTYEITITHNDDPLVCTTTNGEEVFEFVFTVDRVTDNDSSGSTGASGTAFIDEEAMTVRSTALADSTPGIHEGAWASIGYELEVTSNSMYEGNVKARVSVTLTTDGTMILTNGTRPSDWTGGALSISWAGIITVSIPIGGGGEEPYGSAVAAADCSIKIAEQPEAQRGDAKRDYFDVDFPDWGDIQITEEFDMGLNQLHNDITRTFTVAEPIDMWCKIAVGSCLSDIVYNGPYFLSPRVDKNEQTINSVEVEEYDAIFEISE